MHGQHSIAECNLRRRRRHICGAHWLGNFGLRIRRAHGGWQPRCGCASRARISLGRCSSHGNTRTLSCRSGQRPLRIRGLPDSTCGGRPRRNARPVSRIGIRLARASSNSGTDLWRGGVLLSCGGQGSENIEAADCKAKPSHDVNAFFGTYALDLILLPTCSERWTKRSLLALFSSYFGFLIVSARRI